MFCFGKKSDWMFNIFVVELEKKLRVKEGILPDLNISWLASLPINFVSPALS